MLCGKINSSREPVVPLILLSERKKIEYDAVIDTGFNGYISVPIILAKGLDWIHIGYEEYEIATGEIVRQAVYLGKVLFDHKEREIYAVTSKSKDVLIGTSLLINYLLTINFKSRSLTLKKV